MRERLVGNDIKLTSGDLTELEQRNWGEYIFAAACLKKSNLNVWYQVRVKEKVIDFLVKNSRVIRRSEGKLVEVTETPEKKARKNSQIRAMKESGIPGVVLYGQNLDKINNAMEKKR